MNKRQKLSGLVLLLGAVSLIGCTRAKETDSNVSIAMPAKMSSQKVGAQSYDTLGHLIINVTGPGIAQPILYTWDAHNDFSTTPLAPPPSFDLVIPQGSSRMIQVLAVYMDGSNNMQFYYGDLTKNLASSTETAAISISAISTGATFLSGNIMGRYLTSDANVSGPTGPVDITYTPPGKPTLIIERNFMWNGWFHFFGLIGVKFGYRLPDGSQLFGKEVDLSESDFPAGSKILRVTKPIHQRQDYSYGGTPSWSTENAEIYVYGFFGPGAGSRLMCANSAPAPTKLARADSNPAGSSVLAVDISASTVPSISDLASLTNIPSVFVRGDSTSYNALGACSTVVGADIYKSWFKFVPTMLENGNDNAAGFRGFFTVDPTTGSPFNTNYTATGVTLTGTLLPGLEYTFDKLTLMKKVGVDLNNNSDWTSCSQLASNGFVSAGEALVTGPSFTINAAITSTEMSGKVALAMCPSKAGVMFPMGSWVKLYGCMGNCGGGGGGGGGSVATALAISELPAIPLYNFCTRMLVRAVDGGGAPAMVPNPFSVTFTTTNAAVYSDASCSQSVATGNVDPAGTYFFMKAPAASTAGSIQAVYASGLPSALTSSSVFSYTSSAASSMTSFSILADNRYTRHQYECIPFYLAGRDASGNDASMSIMNAGIGANYSTGGISANFYSDSNCATQITGYTTTPELSPFSAAAFRPVYVRSVNTGSLGITLTQVSGTACSGSPCTATTTTTLAPNLNGAAAILNLNSDYLTTLAPGTCKLITVEVSDMSGWPTTSAAGQNVHIALSGGANCNNVSYIGLMDSDCASNIAVFKDIVIPAGENRVVLGIKNVAAGSGACSTTATLATPAISSNTLNTNW